MVSLLKKPHNTIQGPVAPFIQRDPPRFQWAGKFNNVQTDSVLRNTETKTQYYQDAVLAVSRDQNQRKYGIRSRIGNYVNKNFRPPLLDPEYDMTALSRIPRPRTQARTNPIAPYQVQQNGHDPNVGSFIDDRKINSSVKTGMAFRVENPSDYQVCPDLEFTLPQTKAESFNSAPIKTTRIENNVRNKKYKNPQARGQAINSAPIKTTRIENNVRNKKYKNPQTRGQAINSAPIKTTRIENNVRNKKYKNPQTRGQAIKTADYKSFDTSGKDYTLLDPIKVSADSGITTNVRSFTPIDSDALDLQYNNPQVDARAHEYNPRDSVSRYETKNHKMGDKLQVSAVSSKTGANKSLIDEGGYNITLNSKRELGSYQNIPSLPQSFQNQQPKLKSKRGS